MNTPETPKGPSSQERDAERREQALRDLDRVTAESETVAGSTLVRMAQRAQNHLGAADKPENERIEVWGTRIGRAAGLLFAAGLLIHLLLTYL